MQTQEDVREEELTALEAIYPEVVRSKDVEYGGSIQVPVDSDEGVSVLFDEHGSTDVYCVHHLPPIDVSFELPDGYPTRKPPLVRVACAWMEPAMLRRLTKNALQIWDDQRDQVLFAILDGIREDVSSGRWAGGAQVSVPGALRQTILEFDGSAEQSRFEQQTFKCDICQNFRKGEACTRLVGAGCGHVFCTQCLVDFFTACIQQGYVDQVACPQPGCTSSALDAAQLQSLVGPALARRFADLRDKRRVESSPQLWVQCPSGVCGAAVRRNPDDLLCVCEQCGFAFCSVCKRSWHGYYEYCRMQVPPPDLIQRYIDGDDAQRRAIELEWGKRNMARIVAEYEGDRLFRAYMETNANRECPRCAAPIEKTMGCNKMTCLICKTFFCFLCGETLSHADPYAHYSDRTRPCFQKLFEGTDIEAAVNEEDLIRFALAD